MRSKKWPIIGAILALTSSLVYAFNGLLIKTFKLDFVDTLFVRSVLQTIFLFILLKVRKIPILLEFSPEEERNGRIKKYLILIFQVSFDTFCYFSISQMILVGNLLWSFDDVFLFGCVILPAWRCYDGYLQRPIIHHAIFIPISKDSSRIVESLLCIIINSWSDFGHQATIHVSKSR